jgi:6-pyruvoyltetrahydropterin/6-carboxytetrahydropterin synthase
MIRVPLMLLTFDYELPMGHRLMNHQGKCRYLHGHNYLIRVELQGHVDMTGMVIDFSDLKTRVKGIFERWDHAFALHELDPAAEEIRAYARLILLPVHPTAEELAITWRDELQKSFPIHHVYIAVKETRDCGVVLE